MKDQCKVLFFTKYPRRGPSSRYRVYQFLPYLKREGISFSVNELHTDRYLDYMFSGRKMPFYYYLFRLLRRFFYILSSVRYHVIFIQKELFPYVPPIFEVFLRLLRRRLVYDIDDAVFLYYTRSKNPIVRLFLSSKIGMCLKLSHCVLAGNGYLRDYASRFNSNVRLFPTVVDTLRYDTALSKWSRDRSTNNTKGPVIGWIGSNETLPYLVEIEPALRKLANKYKFKLLVIGTRDLKMEGVEVETVEWSESREIEELLRCDIGIMPLPSDEWAEGKCGLKLLQYMACSLPVVSSPSGGGLEIVEHGRNGFIARDQGEWVKYLSTLIDNEELRVRFGREGRRRVHDFFSLSHWAPVMKEVLLRVAGD